MKLKIEFAGNAKNIQAFFATLKDEGPKMVVDGSSRSHFSRLGISEIDSHHPCIDRRPLDIRFFAMRMTTEQRKKALDAGDVATELDINHELSVAGLSNMFAALGRKNEIILCNQHAARKYGDDCTIAIFKNPKHFSLYCLDNG